MGKQTSFYMEREVFQELAQEAIDCGCLILRQSGNKIVSSRDTSIITASCDQYYFYLPEAGELDEDLPLGCFNVNGSMVIEANYTTRNKDHSLHRARLYLMTSVPTLEGAISTPDCMVKLYKKLVRKMKMLTKFVPIPAERMSNRMTYYADPSDRSHKLYLTPKMIKLMEKPNVNLC